MNNVIRLTDGTGIWTVCSAKDELARADPAIFLTACQQERSNLAPWAKGRFPPDFASPCI